MTQGGDFIHPIVIDVGILMYEQSTRVRLEDMRLATPGTLNWKATVYRERKCRRRAAHRVAVLVMKKRTQVIVKGLRRGSFSYRND